MPTFLETVWIVVSFPELRTTGGETHRWRGRAHFFSMLCWSCSLDKQAGCLIDMRCGDRASSKDSGLEYGADRFQQTLDNETMMDCQVFPSIFTPNGGTATSLDKKHHRSCFQAGTRIVQLMGGLRLDCKASKIPAFEPLSHLTFPPTKNYFPFHVI